MQKSFKISIIIPSYNNAQFILEAIDSVLNQTYANLECLVIDDGSADNTKELIAPLLNKDSRLKYIYQDNQGLSAARNKGIKSATGDFLAFLDADDKWTVGKLTNQVKLIHKKRANFIYSNYLLFDHVGTYQNQEPKFNNLPVIADFFGPHPIRGSGSSVLISRKLIQQVGFFDVNLRCSEDVDYWYRCALETAIFAYCDSEDVLLRNHGHSMSSNSSRMYYANFILLDKQFELLKKHNIEIDKNQLSKRLRLRLSRSRYYANLMGRKDLALFTHLYGIKRLNFKYFNILSSKQLLTDIVRFITKN